MSLASSVWHHLFQCRLSILVWRTEQRCHWHHQCGIISFSADSASSSGEQNNDVTGIISMASSLSVQTQHPRLENRTAMSLASSVWHHLFQCRLSILVWRTEQRCHWHHQCGIISFSADSASSSGEQNNDVTGIISMASSLSVQTQHPRLENRTAMSLASSVWHHLFQCRLSILVWRTEQRCHWHHQCGIISFSADSASWSGVYGSKSITINTIIITILSHTEDNCSISSFSADSASWSEVQDSNIINNILNTTTILSYMGNKCGISSFSACRLSILVSSTHAYYIFGTVISFQQWLHDLLCSPCSIIPHIQSIHQTEIFTRHCGYHINVININSTPPHPYTHTIHTHTCTPTHTHTLTRTHALTHTLYSCSQTPL